MTPNVQPAPPLDRNWVAARIPRSGAMCPLNTVVTRDDTRIRCNTMSHRDTANPLRSHGQLTVVYGIEYAAQMMAVHGILCDAAQIRPCADLLASVRSIGAHVLRLGTIGMPLDVEAKRVDGNGVNMLYHSTMRSGACILLTDHVAVMLDASIA